MSDASVTPPGSSMPAATQGQARLQRGMAAAWLSLASVRALRDSGAPSSRLLAHGPRGPQPAAAASALCATHPCAGSAPGTAPAPAWCTRCCPRTPGWPPGAACRPAGVGRCGVVCLACWLQMNPHMLLLAAAAAAAAAAPSHKHSTLKSGSPAQARVRGGRAAAERTLSQRGDRREMKPMSAPSSQFANICERNRQERQGSGRSRRRRQHAGCPPAIFSRTSLGMSLIDARACTGCCGASMAVVPAAECRRAARRGP